MKYLFTLSLIVCITATCLSQGGESDLKESIESSSISEVTIPESETDEGTKKEKRIQKREAKKAAKSEVVYNYYDFQSGTPSSIKPANDGQMTYYRVDNINRFLYDVTINGTIVSNNTTVPGVFNQILTANATNDSNVENIIQDQTTDSDFDSELGDLKSQEEQVKEQLNYFTEKRASGNKSLFELHGFNNDASDEAFISEQIASLSQVLSEIESEVSALESSKSKQEKLYNSVISTSLVLDRLYDELETSKALKESLINITLSNSLDAEKAEDLIIEATDQYGFMRKSIYVKAKFEAAVNAFNKAYQNYISDPDVFEQYEDNKEKVIASVAKLKEEVDRLNSIVDKTDYNSITHDISALKNALLDPKTYFVTSDPIQSTGDEVKFEVKATPKPNLNTYIQTGPLNITSTVPVKGGIKIDFSTGFIGSVGLSNRSYSTKILSDSTKFSVTKNNNRNFANLNLGAFMHIYGKNGTNGHWAGTFGLGLNSTDLNDIDVYLGGSRIFGRNDRIVLSAGLALSQIEYLKSDLKIGEDNDISKYDIDKQFTEKAIRPGGFVAFSYNLSN